MAAYGSSPGPVPVRRPKSRQWLDGTPEVKEAEAWREVEERGGASRAQRKRHLQPASATDAAEQPPAPAPTRAPNPPGRPRRPPTTDSVSDQMDPLPAYPTPRGEK